MDTVTSLEKQIAQVRKNVKRKYDMLRRCREDDLGDRMIKYYPLREPMYHLLKQRRQEIVPKKRRYDDDDDVEEEIEEEVEDEENIFHPLKFPNTIQFPNILDLFSHNNPLPQREFLQLSSVESTSGGVDKIRTHKTRGSQRIRPYVPSPAFGSFATRIEELGPTRRDLLETRPTPPTQNIGEDQIRQLVRNILIQEYQQEETQQNSSEDLVTKTSPTPLTQNVRQIVLDTLIQLQGEPQRETKRQGGLQQEVAHDQKESANVEGAVGGAVGGGGGTPLELVKSEHDQEGALGGEIPMASPYGDISGEYVEQRKNNDSQCDGKYGVNFNGKDLTIGDSILTIEDDMISIGKDLKINATKGLLELLFMKEPNQRLIQKHDMMMFKKIITSTNLHRKRYSMTDQYNSDASDKWLLVKQSLGMKIPTPALPTPALPKPGSRESRKSGGSKPGSAGSTR